MTCARTCRPNTAALASRTVRFSRTGPRLVAAAVVVVAAGVKMAPGARQVWERQPLHADLLVQPSPAAACQVTIKFCVLVLSPPSYFTNGVCFRRKGTAGEHSQGSHQASANGCVVAEGIHIVKADHETGGRVYFLFCLAVTATCWSAQPAYGFTRALDREERVRTDICRAKCHHPSLILSNQHNSYFRLRIVYTSYPAM